MPDWTRRELGGALTPFVLSACAPAAPRPVLPRKDFAPAYARLERAGLLAPRIAALKAIYKDCRLCPRACGVDRTKGGKGVCQLPARAKVASAHAHFGEERPLVGRGGSGTIFFSRCNLLCEFCQNWEINHRGDGSWMSEDELAGLMLSLQRDGCENINFVTPTHLAPTIIEAVRRAHARGLRLPLVWNCGGYENAEVIRLLEGVVDIYLPDFKWMDSSAAAQYSAGAKDYPERAAESILEMHRQVGGLLTDERGVALRGLIVRHLVMPHNLARTDLFVKWAAERLGPDASVNIMGQYRPAHRASKFPLLARRLTSAEYAQALEWARAAGLKDVTGG
jgi:putative pyruvate formate lyase activating enzyme